MSLQTTSSVIVASKYQRFTLLLRTRSHISTFIFAAIAVCVAMRGDRRENSVSVKFDISDTPEERVDNVLEAQQNTFDADLNKRSCLKQKINMKDKSIDKAKRVGQWNL